MDQVISPGEGYENIVEALQQLARSLLIFGLHVHVAVPCPIGRPCSSAFEFLLR
jgi:gamma-glutamyl:cysteine ligase YbdK (ATP-grasp superfamily)